MMSIFENTKFEGPVSTDGEHVPSSPGVYLVCTYASGGDKILGVYESEDMRASLLSNPKRQCWEKNKLTGSDTYSGNIELTVHYFVEPDRRTREKLCRKIIDNRPYKVICNDPIADDF